MTQPNVFICTYPGCGWIGAERLVIKPLPDPDAPLCPHCHGPVDELLVDTLDALDYADLQPAWAAHLAREATYEARYPYPELVKAFDAPPQSVHFREKLLMAAVEATEKAYAGAAAFDAPWDTDAWCHGCAHYEPGGYDSDTGGTDPTCCNVAWDAEANGHLDHDLAESYETVLFTLSQRNACPFFTASDPSTRSVSEEGEPA